MEQISKLVKNEFKIDSLEKFAVIIGLNPSFFVDIKRPVEKVNWFEAVEYCLQIGKRLPNEWEWEWASR